MKMVGNPPKQFRQQFAHVQFRLLAPVCSSTGFSLLPRWSSNAGGGLVSGTSFASAMRRVTLGEVGTAALLPGVGLGGGAT